jgi:hypothetical protein
MNMLKQTFGSEEVAYIKGLEVLDTIMSRVNFLLVITDIHYMKFESKLYRDYAESRGYRWVKGGEYLYIYK